MKVSIQFQYQPDEKRRPIDGADHNEPKEQQLIENSGREVTVARKVKTRHFHYAEDYVTVNVVVTDVPVGEMAMRLKE